MGVIATPHALALETEGRALYNFMSVLAVDYDMLLRSRHGQQCRAAPVHDARSLKCTCVSSTSHLLRTTSLVLCQTSERTDIPLLAIADFRILGEKGRDNLAYVSPSCSKFRTAFKMECTSLIVVRRLEY